MESAAPPVLSEAEVEFLAEEAHVEIIPSFTEKQLSFVDGTYGPFRPTLPTRVPLWLAVHLKKLNKCQFVVPKWMEFENLQALHKREQDEDKLQALPFHYLEIGTLLLQHGHEDVPSADKVRTLLHDIHDVRQNKLRRTLRQISAKSSVLKFSNIAAMELNAMRPLCVQAMDNFRVLSGVSARVNNADLTAAAAERAEGKQR